MKRLAVLIVSAVAACLLATGTAFADNLTLAGSKAVAEPGQTVRVDFSVAGVSAQGIAGFELTVISELGISGISKGDALEDCVFQGNVNNGKVLAASSGKAASADGVLFSVWVTVPADIGPGEYRLSVEVLELYGVDLVDYQVGIRPGTIAVRERTGASEPSDPSDMLIPTDKPAPATPETASGPDAEPDVPGATGRGSVSPDVERLGVFIGYMTGMKAFAGRSEGTAGPAPAGRINDSRILPV